MRKRALPLEEEPQITLTGADERRFLLGSKEGSTVDSTAAPMTHRTFRLSRWRRDLGNDVEIKTQSALGGLDDTRIINNLKASRTEVGLLMNFGGPLLESTRFVNTLGLTCGIPVHLRNLRSSLVAVTGRLRTTVDH